MKLVFTSDGMPGYRRLRSGRGFSYRLPDGKLLVDPGERKRIRALVIPPAYEEVWICMLENGHLQATGLDARGRKQYRYHPLWHEHAAERKFEKLAEFAAALPKIRAAVRRQLAREELTRGRVIAGVVLLLDETGYRIGNARYERDNRTYGIASLLTRHLEEEEGELQLRFIGKSGQRHEATVSNPRLTRLLEELQELPGQHLFRYENPGRISKATSTAGCRRSPERNTRPRISGLGRRRSTVPANLPPKRHPNPRPAASVPSARRSRRPRHGSTIPPRPAASSTSTPPSCGAIDGANSTGS